MQALRPLAAVATVASIVFAINLESSTDGASTPARSAGRTVVTSEIGSIFAYPPPGITWRDFGAYVGVAGSDYFSKMSEGGLKIEQGRFQHFQPDDDKCCSFFPYSLLKEFEAREIAQGLPPLFVTATYQGKKRPVYFAWSLDLKGGDVPTTPRHTWMQAVDVRSDRYLDFWVNKYVRGRLRHGRRVSSDWWVGLDNCAFMWELYGVIDDGGRFVSGVRWDHPFPQNSDEFLGSIKQFFHKLRQVAPDIKVMCNVGSLKDPGQFQSLFADVPGIMEENISEPNPLEYARRGQFDELNFVSWFGARGGVAVLRAIVPLPANAEQLRTACALYWLIRGPNFFFDPEEQGSAYTMLPDRYAEMRSALGEPTELMRTKPDAAKGNPYTLYSRKFQRGIVYVNWTGKPQQITLPSDQHYFDPGGQRAKAITLADLAGTYMTTEQPSLAKR